MKCVVQNLITGYGRDPLSPDALSFTHTDGAILSILGPNGVGKTTLLKTLLGLIPALGGSIHYNEKPLSDWTPREFWQKVGYVPQAKSVQGASITLEEMVVLGRSPRMGLFAQPSRKDWAAVERALATVGMNDFASRSLHALSGGQLQLGLIARALVNDPEWIILDEPESHLDFKNQERVLSVIHSLKTEGLGAIFNTHFPHHAIELADQAILMGEADAPLVGPAKAVLTAENLSKALDVPIEIGTIAGRTSIVVPHTR